MIGPILGRAIEQEIDHENRLWAVCVAVLAGACAQVPPEMQVVDDAAAALGGKDRIQAVKTLVIEGEGPAPNVGQNRMPDGELPVWKVTEFKRSIDLASGRTRMQQLRTAQFLFAGATVQRQNQALDGDVAYNVGPGWHRDAGGRGRGSRSADRAAASSDHHRARGARSGGEGDQSPPAGDRSGRRRDHRQGRHAHAGRRRHHQAAVARHVDGRQRQHGRRRDRDVVLRIRGRERPASCRSG